MILAQKARPGNGSILKRLRLHLQKRKIFSYMLVHLYNNNNKAFNLQLYACSLICAIFVFELKIAPDDIRWEGEDLGGITERKYLHNGGAHVRGATRGRGIPGLQNRSKNEENVGPIQNGVPKKSSDKIHVPNTESIIKEVFFVIVNFTISNLVSSIFSSLITAVHWVLKNISYSIHPHNMFIALLLLMYTFMEKVIN
jgi:hypothetical protein